VNWIYLAESIVPGGLWSYRYKRRRVARRERKQATEVDCLTRARDSECSEPCKTRPPLSVSVTWVGGCCAERDRERIASYWSWLADEGTWLWLRRTVQNSTIFICAIHFSEHYA
jgi:hypothetical protein